ncbi:integrase, catalytic region, zinc finger, CCHC-type containing protein [Tanacetum coccineum]
METTYSIETLAEGNEGALHLGSERPRVYSDLSPEDKERYNADIWATKILLQGLPKYIYTLINHYTDAKDIWDNVKMLLEGSELTKEDRESQLYDDFKHFRQNKGETIHDYYVRFVTAVKLNRGLRDSNYDQLYAYLKQHEAHANENKMMNQATVQDGRVVVQNVQGRQNRGQRNNAWGAGATGYGGAQNRVRNANLEYFKDKMLMMQAQENGVTMDEEKLLFIAADDCDAFDSDVDEAPTAQTMFMANLSSAYPVYDEASPSYDSDILSEVHDNDHYQDAVCEHHEVHEMHDDVQPNYVVDSHADYTSDSNMIPYDQYVKDNAVPVVQSNVSSVPNDAYMMILNDIYEPSAQCVSVTTQNNVVDNSLTAELATYKEQVELYERRAKFELTEREQKINEQLRIVIADRNRKEENLKRELHSVKLQLTSTINHNKSMVEEVTSLKKDFKQKENKYLKEFLDMKALKKKVEDKLYKQDQSLQTVHMLCKLKPYYDEQNKVAIGYKNPLCLTCAKQVQPALYNDHEIIKTNHVPAIVHNSEDTLEIAEITRKKMKDPECVKKKVKIAPHDYFKENYLATFTPQKQLTPEQIFLSKDLIKMKAEALKEQTTTSRPLNELTMYPSNTPATLVPRVLLTKSQVKINIFTLIQLFLEFEKTCKKRITPTGLTEREWGFKQTKECYLTEVIPLFKTLKEHFEGIQNALTKEIKEIKENLEELKAESYIATNFELTVSRFTKMHAAHTIVQAHCLKLEAELSKLHDKVQKDDHTELLKRFSNLEVNHLNLQLKYQNLKEHFGNNTSLTVRDAPDFDTVFVIEKIKASIQGKDNAIKKLRMQISQLNETRSETDRTLDFRALDFQITQLTNKVTVLQEQNELFKTENAKIKYAIDVEPILPRNRNNREMHLDYLKHLKESVETLREIIEEAKVERPLDSSLAFACLYTKNSHELLEYVIGTCPKDFNQQDKNHVATPLTRKKQVSFEDQCETSNSNTHKRVEQLCIQKTNVSVPPSTGVNSCTVASGSQPTSNTKKNRIFPSKSVNMKQVEEHPRTNKSSLKTTNRVDSSISSKRKKLTSVGYQWRPTRRIFTLGEQCPLTRLTKTKVVPATQTENVVQIVLWYLDSGCSKHMMGDHLQLRNFVKKFTGTVRFRNDHFGAIMCYGDYVIGDSVISMVYYVEGLGHNLFSVGQFYDSDLEVAFRKHSCYVRNTDGVKLIKGSRGSNLYTISVEDMMKSSPICLLSKASKNKSWLWHRRLNHLNFGTINDLARKDLVRGLPRLKFEKDHLCSACQLGKSKKHTYTPKAEHTNLKVLNTLHMDLCGPMRMQTINGKKYILVIVDDYSRFTWVKFLRLKDETPEFVIKFLKQIQVGLNKTVRYIRTDNGTEFVNKDLIAYYESAPMFLWAEAVATTCYTQNRSLIYTRPNKTPYELVHDKKSDLTFFRVFGALCYFTNDSENLGKLQPTADIGIFLSEPMAPVQLSTRSAPTFLMPEQISSRLVPNPVPAAPYVPPTNKELKILFQPMFDEYLEPLSVERPVSPTPAVPVPVNSAITPSSTTINQDAPSPSHSPSSSTLQSPSFQQGVVAESTSMADTPLAPVDNDPFVNVFAPEPSSETSSSGDVSSA